MPGLIWLCVLLIVSCHDGVDGVTEFIYNGFARSKLHLDGEASISKHGVLSLTSSSCGDSSFTQGHGFHPEALPFVNSHGASMSFSATFVFSITPTDSDTSGDGMAFVISLAPLSGTWTDGQYLGLVNQDDDGGTLANRFFAIELDTVANWEFRDIDNNHVGIDLNNLTSAASSTAGYYSDNVEKDFHFFNPLRLSSGKPMQVWVDYYEMQLNVTLAPVPMNKPSSPLLSYYPTILQRSSRMTPNQRQGFQPQHTSVSLPPAVIGITTCLLFRWWWCKKRMSERNEDWEAELGPHRFAYKDLRRATNGFDDNQLLGKGGFGQVYRGVLGNSGMDIAVKRVSSESKQGLTEFTAEVIILGRLRHRNLVRLIGYCRHKVELLLVYEYMPNGSLDSYMHTQTRHTMLSWCQRLHIIRGVACGLLYLHEDWEQVIIHRDIKASNVLLDGEMNGRLGDFGLARLHDHGADAHTTHVAGTRGYLAPELTRFGKATKATDVFAFGAFVLEVACGRRPVGFNARGELLVLVQWVRDTWGSGSCSILDTVDPRLDEYAADEAELVLKLGLLCSHPLPVARPSMRLVMRYLDGDLPLPEFSPEYLNITDVDQVLDEVPPSMANSITGLSGGR
ncbi:L-type lectin-domain containing receptor kinase IV.2 [Triticum urartu]|uniref:L-type lectin-domain containing receptor kinase IV.2 n=2 Tax=Triticum urartu TaxID=4572 RepID=M7ZYC5_TRIUA|nr:L-type lectin-domain containing receptor kinase IV.2 [Triticum urartu]